MNQVGGWTIRAVRLNGTDITDAGVEFKPNENISGLEVELTNKLTTISGLVTNARGETVKEYAAIAFAQDKEKWKVFGRYQGMGRPDQDGRFKISGLPPSDYYVVALDKIDPGQMTDPEFLDAIRIRATADHHSRGRNAHGRSEDHHATMRFQISEGRFQIFTGLPIADRLSCRAAGPGAGARHTRAGRHGGDPRPRDGRRRRPSAVARRSARELPAAQGEQGGPHRRRRPLRDRRSAGRPLHRRLLAHELRARQLRPAASARTRRADRRRRTGRPSPRIDAALQLAGVVTGRIVDEFGDPVTNVRVVPMRYQFINGERRIQQAGGGGTTNDLGEYRIYGLLPGRYFVSATLQANQGGDSSSATDSDRLRAHLLSGHRQHRGSAARDGRVGPDDCRHQHDAPARSSRCASAASRSTAGAGRWPAPWST